MTELNELNLSYIKSIMKKKRGWVDNQAITALKHRKGIISRDDIKQIGHSDLYVKKEEVEPLNELTGKGKLKAFLDFHNPKSKIDSIPQMFHKAMALRVAADMERNIANKRGDKEWAAGAKDKASSMRWQAHRELKKMREDEFIDAEWEPSELDEGFNHPPIAHWHIVKHKETGQHSVIKTKTSIGAQTIATHPGSAYKYISSFKNKKAALQYGASLQKEEQQLTVNEGVRVYKPAIAKKKYRTPLEGHPYHSKTDAELHYIIRDAGEAARAMQGHSPKAENKYLDQVNDASTVLHHRRTRGGFKEEQELGEGYKIGDKVIPNVGPHKNHPHEIIHILDDGSMNIRPIGFKGAKGIRQNKYRLGAAHATTDQVKKVVNEAKWGRTGSTTQWKPFASSGRVNHSEKLNPDELFPSPTLTGQAKKEAQIKDFNRRKLLDGIRKAASKKVAEAYVEKKKKAVSWNSPEVQAKAAQEKKENKQFASAKREINRLKKAGK